MPKVPRVTPYGAVERDLARLVNERVSEAIFSVVQISPSKEASMQIAIAAMTTAMGAAAGAFRAVHPEFADPNEFNERDYARVILNLVDEVAKERG